MDSLKTLVIVISAVYLLTVALFVWFITLLRSGHREEIIRLEGALKYGDTQPLKEALPVAGARDPEQRIEPVVSEETLDRAIRDLQDDYRKMGLTLTDDEARVQVLAMASGIPLTQQDVI